MGKPVIQWDGKNLPKGLKRVPPGRYALEVVQDTAPLTKAEKQGLLKAMRQLDAGQGTSLAQVISAIRKKSARA